MFRWISHSRAMGPPRALGRRPISGFAIIAVALFSVACSGGGGGSGENPIPGLSNSAEPLPMDNFSYVTSPLEHARYLHKTVRLEDGTVVVVGGSDENLFTSLSSVEVFDQTLRDNPVPETISGGFISTNFVGDPIELTEGGRIFHSVNRLPDGTAIVIGGTFDVLISDAIPVAEVYDPQLREFNATGFEPTNEMEIPRFRHTTTALASGQLLITGGQESVQETIIDPNFPPGSPFFQFNLTVFPTVTECELYDPASRSFSLASSLLGDPTELQTPRGRTDHAEVTVAGFDGLLGTGDDVTLFAGGYQSLSGVFAPDTKFPGSVDTSNQTSVEFYDLSSGIIATAAGISVASRANGATGLNLGEFAPQTPDGVDGMNNIGFFLGGDSNGPGGCTNSTAPSDLVVCTFTGFGPASGIQFHGLQETGGMQGVESTIADNNCSVIGRTMGDALLMRNRRTYEGSSFLGNWVVTGGGHDIRVTPTGCQETGVGVCAAPTLQGFAYFDPFYNFFSVEDPNDLLASRNPDNPTGVIGTWLQADEQVPDDEFDGFGETTDITGVLRRARVGHTLTRLAGVDGADGTPDDRVLVVGGGSDFWNTWGGEAVSVVEIYLPVGANE
ncbi:MAG: hypothetical protein AAF488_10680 [Planctomycetota bacterium]